MGPHNAAFVYGLRPWSPAAGVKGVSCDNQKILLGSVWRIFYSPHCPWLDVYAVEP